MRLTDFFTILACCTSLPVTRGGGDPCHASILGQFVGNAFVFAAVLVDRLPGTPDKLAWTATGLHFLLARANANLQFMR